MLQRIIRLLAKVLMRRVEVDIDSAKVAIIEIDKEHKKLRSELTLLDYELRVMRGR